VSLQDDITRLVKPPPAAPRLSAAGAPDALRDKTGLERKTRAGADVSGEEVTVASTDGLFTFTVRVLA
jgi:hypothetical protein